MGGAIVVLGNGRYKLLDLLGEGYFGEVYVAEDREFDETVAIKLPSDEVELDEVLLEARILARLRKHERIVTIRDVELQPPRPFIVMDYLPNGSVGARLERGEVTVLDAVRWTREALDGLAHAHALGVMHRDIKPTNLLIDETGGAVLSDFGLAEDTVRRRIVHADYLYGAHAAPELRAGGLTTPASDCFALGCTAYRLLSSEYPYADKRAAAAGDHVPVHEHNPQIPNSLSKFVSKALAPRPDDRFASAHEMRGAVLKCSVFGSWTKVSELPNERWVATNEDASYELSIAPSKHGYMLLVRRDLGKGFRHLTREEARSPAKLSQARRRLLRKLVEGKEFV